MRLLIIPVLFLTLFLVVGCQEETPETGSTAPQQVKDAADAGPPPPAASPEPAPLDTPPSAAIERTPPGPPLLENFQGIPQIRLFPWVDEFRPAEEGNRLHDWNTLIDLLVRGTGIAEDRTTGNRSWILPSIMPGHSSGYFAPLSVAPQTSYQVSFKLSADLPQGATAGIRISEFNEFLWIGGQYTEDQFKAHFLRNHEGKSLTGKVNGQQSFTFTTGSDTHMIHLVLFREGVQNGKSIMFDDIEVDHSTGN